MRIGDLLNGQQQQDFKYLYGRGLAFASKTLKLRPSESAELVDRAMAQAVTRIGQYVEQPGVPFLAWFRRVLINLVLDEFRHQQRAKRLQNEAREATTPGCGLPADLALINQQARRNRDRLVAKLAPALRRVFEIWVLQKDREIDRSEAAARLGCTVERYEADKKKVVRAMNEAMLELAIRPEDLRSEVPPKSGNNAEAAGDEEDGT